jgi:hypothetical protein
MPRNRPDVPSNSRATCSPCGRELLLRIELQIGLCSSCIIASLSPVEPAAPQPPPQPPSST